MFFNLVHAPTYVRKIARRRGITVKSGEYNIENHTPIDLLAERGQFDTVLYRVRNDRKEITITVDDVLPHVL